MTTPEQLASRIKHVRALDKLMANIEKGSFVICEELGFAPLNANDARSLYQIISDSR